MAHARRKYTDALKLNPRDEAALRMTQLMNGLFAMDAEARRRGLT
jgi:hypothetical protein